MKLIISSLSGQPIYLEDRVQSLLGEAVDTARRAGMEPDRIRGLLDGLLGDKGSAPASEEGKE